MSSEPLLPWNDPEPTDQPWRNLALCAKDETNAFFPFTTSPNKHHEISRQKEAQIAKAQAICRQCPVQISCLKYAKETDQQWGIWGGKLFTEQNRTNKKKQQRTICIYGHPLKHDGNRTRCYTCNNHNRQTPDKINPWENTSQTKPAKPTDKK